MFWRLLPILGVLLLVCTRCLCFACAQKTPVNSSQLDRAIALARSPTESVSSSEVNVIVRAGALQAIPALEQQFHRAPEGLTKLIIASGLVKLRDQDETYWKYLLQQATMAVDSDIPDFSFPESPAKASVNNPDLQAWADAHNVTFNTAGVYALREFPIKVLALAMAADPRGLPLLQRALQARDVQIAIAAAKGLALLGDKASIPLIAAAAAKAPKGLGSLIAEPLVYLNDPEAQQAVDRYVPKEKASLLREAKAQGAGILNW